jgi:hypothetical protein
MVHRKYICILYNRHTAMIQWLTLLQACSEIVHATKARCLIPTPSFSWWKFRNSGKSGISGLLSDTGGPGRLVSTAVTFSVQIWIHDEQRSGLFAQACRIMSKTGICKYELWDVAMLLSVSLYVEGNRKCKSVIRPAQPQLRIHLRT